MYFLSFVSNMAIPKESMKIKVIYYLPICAYYRFLDLVHTSLHPPFVNKIFICLVSFHISL